MASASNRRPSSGERIRLPDESVAAVPERFLLRDPVVVDPLYGALAKVLYVPLYVPEP